MQNMFGFLREALQHDNVKTIEEFNETLAELDPNNEMLKHVAYRTAKSVLKTAVLLGVDYFGKGKSAIEHLNAQAKNHVE